MPEINPSELRNHSSCILSRVEHGERFTLIHGNILTAEVILAQERAYRTHAEVAAAVATLPPVDARELRADLDVAVDSEIVFDD